MDLQHTADLLESRTPLDRPPIALAFVDEQPDDVKRLGSAIPSSCAFWREAETDVFYASAQDHYNCTLGAMVMGLPLPDEQMQLLMQDVGMMCETEYVREEEVPNVPKVESKPNRRHRLWPAEPNDRIPRRRPALGHTQAGHGDRRKRRTHELGRPTYRRLRTPRLRRHSHSPLRRTHVTVVRLHRHEDQLRRARRVHAHGRPSR